MMKGKVGPMFCGKSMWLVSRYHRHRLQRVCVVVSKKDDRAGTPCINGMNCIVRLDATFAVNDAAEVLAHERDYDVFLFDEIQFIKKAGETMRALADHGKVVYYAGLDLDRTGAPFPETVAAMMLSDSYCKMSSACGECGRKAGFTRLRRNAVSNGTVIQVGGSETYIPLCHACVLVYEANVPVLVRPDQ